MVSRPLKLPFISKRRVASRLPFFYELRMQATVRVLSDQLIEIDFPEITQDSCIVAYESLRNHEIFDMIGEWILADRNISLLLKNGASDYGDLERLAIQIRKYIGSATFVSRQDVFPRRKLSISWGGECGQDLDVVAKRLKLSVPSLIKKLEGLELNVAFNGFLPGFAYLTGLPDELKLPRRESPRARVPAGALAMAGDYLAVYPAESPGGWHLLGHCEEELFSLENEIPCLLSPGSVVTLHGKQTC